MCLHEPTPQAELLLDKSKHNMEQYNLCLRRPCNCLDLFYNRLTGWTDFNLSSLKSQILIMILYQQAGNLDLNQFESRFPFVLFSYYPKEKVDSH